MGGESPVRKALRRLFKLVRLEDVFREFAEKVASRESGEFTKLEYKKKLGKRD